MNWLRASFVVACVVLSVVGCKTDDTGDGNGTGGMTGTGGVAGMAGMTGGMMPGGMTGGMMAGPTGAATWDAVFTEIIVGTGCTGGPTCHGGTVGAGGLAMPDKATAFAALVNMPAMGTNLPPNPAIPNCIDSGKIRVVPGQPGMSLLVEKVKLNPSCGVQMPVAGMLMPNQVAQIEAWIMAGAMDN